MAATVWHSGELALQRYAGVAERMDMIGPRVVRDHMPDQHRDFFAQLPFVVLGTVAPDGRPWATLRAGLPGFLESPDPQRLDIDFPRDAADPADAGLEDGDAIGLLGIELATRRRNRLNGILHRQPGAVPYIGVRQSFGNCPRYIHPRSLRYSRDPALRSDVPPQTLGALDAPARAWISAADTLFVASYVDLPDAGRQVDVSHRGGAPGFVRLDADGGMTIPDFNGNSFFNTLGNLALNPRAGLVFVDFDSGALLQLSGRTELLLDSREIAEFDGAERLWRFFPEVVVRREQALPLRWAAAATRAT
jgi:predicted pyridoxine 5'-phosphate oxidase superfamily flavin-nucleotide-binding protein